uniref:bone morphogenetic protein receptor type-2-like n=1 Tax=Solea senegalensis TaxID=28829 RepID=UPI001CD9164F|nr:bone morphogenetic protein receptor type-2-like [Solea senegalensis]
MILQQWLVILAAVFICTCMCSPFSLQKRRCAFHLNGTAANTEQNNKYVTSGNVTRSVQVCESTHCCVGYFRVLSGQPVVDLLACDVAEKACPDAVCKTQTRFKWNYMKCVCNTDLCNSNITWTPDSEQPQHTHSNLEVAVTLIGALLVLGFVIAAAKWIHFFKSKKENLQGCPHGHSVSSRLSCQTTKNNEVDVADIELQHILARGYFATVWQAKYRGSAVAVKVLPSDWKHRFTAEKEVYELPLMKHAGILHFLGTGRKQDDGSWLIVVQLAEYGSLCSFLCTHTISWMQSLKLCQSLSQGLSYLHSDLHSYDMHKPAVAHRDLSSSNVLVKADGTCALCDFGCSTILRTCSYQSHLMAMMVRSRQHRVIGQREVAKEDGDAHIFCQRGTLCYMAPEILDGAVDLRSSSCFKQGDIYALGLLLWEIWMRCSALFAGGNVPQHLLPYESELEGNVTLESLIMHVITREKRPSIPKHWELLPQGSALQELLSDCWEFDPDARVTAQCVADRLDSLQSTMTLFPPDLQ